MVGWAFVCFVFLLTKGSLANFFSVMIALVISTTSVSYVFVFPALISLRRKYPDAPRPYRVPGGTAGAWAAVVISELFVIVSAVTLLWPGALNGLFGQSYSIEDNWGVSRAFFEWVTLGSLAAMVLVGVLFWAIGRADRRRGLTADVEAVPRPRRPIPRRAVTDGRAGWESATGPEPPYHCIRVMCMRTLDRGTIAVAHSRAILALQAEHGRKGGHAVWRAGEGGCARVSPGCGWS